MLRVQTIQIGSSAGSSWWCVRHSVCSSLHYVHLKILFEHLVKVVLSCCLSLLVVNYAFYYALLTLLWSIPRVCAATLKILIFFPFALRLLFVSFHPSAHLDHLGVQALAHLSAPVGHQHSPEERVE